MRSFGRRDAAGRRGGTRAIANIAAGFLSLLAITIAALVSLTGDPRPRQTDTPEPAAVSWMCPMHPGVLEAHEGTCPSCRMALVPFHVEAVWSCPLHRVVEAEASGACPVCRRPLVPVQMAVNWTCPGSVHTAALERGTCADGRPMQRTRTLRPHGNHTPQYGGQFFMAADNWHHLEGTHPADGVFQLHVYDDYSRPLPPSELRRISGRVIANDSGVGTRPPQERTAFDLVAAADGSYLTAAIGTAPLPRRLTAKVRFTADGPEHRFDFTFTGVSGIPVTSLEPRPASPARLASPAGAEAAVRTSAVTPAHEVLTTLRRLATEIEEHIDRGDFENVYRPAFTAKDLALSLDASRALPPASQRAAAGEALTSLVQAAWLLDAYGDLGNRQLLTGALAQFTAALSRLDQGMTTSRKLPGAGSGAEPGTAAAVVTIPVPAGSTTGRASQ